MHMCLSSWRLACILIGQHVLLAPPTHEEVEHGHVHDVQQSCPAVIRGRLFHLLTVVWIHLPPLNNTTTSLAPLNNTTTRSLAPLNNTTTGYLAPLNNTTTGYLAPLNNTTTGYLAP